MFVGHLAYPPNVQDAKSLVRDIWPRVRNRFRPRGWPLLVRAHVRPCIRGSTRVSLLQGMSTIFSHGIGGHAWFAVPFITVRVRE